MEQTQTKPFGHLLGTCDEPGCGASLILVVKDTPDGVRGRLVCEAMMYKPLAERSHKATRANVPDHLLTPFPEGVAL